MNKLVILGSLFVVLFCHCVSLAQNDGKTKYEKIEISKFEIKNDTEFPKESLEVLMPEILDELKKISKFQEVSMRDGDVANSGNKVPSGTLSLAGTVTKYQKGSRTARYMIPGAGKTKIVVNIKITDENDKIILEKDVSGSVVLGFFGGSSNGATRNLAKEIAKTIKKDLF